MIPDTAAHAAADAVRDLCRATLAGSGYVYPVDVHEVLGDLTAVVQALPQALRQAAVWLENEHDVGRVGHDSDGNATVAVYGALMGLNDAIRDLGPVVRGLDQARRHCGHLTATTPPEDDT